MTTWKQKLGASAVAVGSLLPVGCGTREQTSDQERLIQSDVLRATEEAAAVTLLDNIFAAAKSFRDSEAMISGGPSGNALDWAMAQIKASKRVLDKQPEKVRSEVLSTIAAAKKELERYIPDDALGERVLTSLSFGKNPKTNQHWQDQLESLTFMPNEWGVDKRKEESKKFAGYLAYIEQELQSPSRQR